MTCNTDCEHPEYEVAAFVMNRLLGFNNMPITVGRQISWFDDVFPVASKRFGKEMTIKNGTDVCFKWRCPSTEVFREFCFHKGIIFGSATIWLNKAVHIVYPYGQEREKYEYHDFHLYAKAKEFYRLPIGVDRFCQEFRTRPPYNDDRMFYHVIDMAAIDYLLNNVDQRHTYIIGDDGLTITNVMIDFGQSFCLRSMILLGAPIYQCCR
ncbi:hypothetical protein CHS0354_004051 [Potamilus streckersoni]|uniref:FAM20 C-terminal domain-containing protein n=1 Tax=Potamilus streckersoni TaxID=2493646 RepID=A0AAE0T847_9BIVA|nr:hypothetical protein CHS0354_004051 [Potamilus streckersoni]